MAQVKLTEVPISSTPVSTNAIIEDNGSLKRYDLNKIKPIKGVDYWTAADQESIVQQVLTDYTETDPTVPAWAKQPNKPTYTADEVGALSKDTIIPDVSPAIIDVIELPTENIKEDVYYRKLTVSLVINQNIANEYICHCVESLPETGLPATNLDQTEGHIYYVVGDSEPYCYVDDMLSMGLNVPAGWYPGATLLETVGYGYSGTITNIMNDPKDGNFRLLLEYVIYSYKDSWTSHKTIGWTGTGSASTIFNHPINIASGNYSHAEGNHTVASGSNSHAEGYFTTASSYGSHAEGQSSNNAFDFITEESTDEEIIAAWNENHFTLASGFGSHAEGSNTLALDSYSHAEGSNTTASGFGSHAEGTNTTASGDSSHAEGTNTTTPGYASHAEGWSTTASGVYSHSEGWSTTASGSYQHVQGKYNITDSNNQYAHIVGNGSYNSRSNAHTLDWNGNAWFAGDVYVGGKDMNSGSKLVTESTVNEITSNAYDELLQLKNLSQSAVNVALSSSLTWDGNIGDKTFIVNKENDTSKSMWVHVCNEVPVDYLDNSVFVTVIAGEISFLAQCEWVSDDFIHSAFYETSSSPMLVVLDSDLDEYIKKGIYFTYQEEFVDDQWKTASYIAAANFYGNSFAKENVINALGYVPAVGESINGENYLDDSHNTNTSAHQDIRDLIDKKPGEIVGDNYAEVFNYNNTASGDYSHAEGMNTTSSGDYSHAEGKGTKASGDYSHAEGYDTKAEGYASHAEGNKTTASGSESHTEGMSTTASGRYSHAEGYASIAFGDYSHAEGMIVHAYGNAQHVQGKYNILDDSDTYAHIVGNGTDIDAHSNAHTLDWDGNAWFQGDVYVGSTSGTNRDEGSKKLATEEFVNQLSENNVVVPDYWQAALDEGVEAINTALCEAGRNKSAFLFYSDAHWNYGSQMSPTLLKYLYNHTGMTKTFFGGDIVNDNTDNYGSIEYLWNWRNKVKGLPNHHSVVGNHDNLQSEKYIYGYMLAAEETSDMVMGDSGLYYYIDSPVEKTRYLCLDTGCQDYLSLSDEQMVFIEESLKSTPDKWHIVVMAHAWHEVDYDQYDQRPVPIAGMTASAQSITTILDNYNNRIGTFADCGAWVEFCIGGHIHYDYDAITSTGIPIIHVETDSYHTRGNYTATAGTNTEASVNGIIADYDSHKIHVVRIGRGESRDVAITNYIIEYHNVLDDVGFVEDKYVSASSGFVEKDKIGVDLTGYIAIKHGDIIRLKNVTMPDTSGYTNMIYCFNKDKVGQNSFSMQSSSANTVYKDGNLVEFTIAGKHLGWDGGSEEDVTGFIRIGAANIDSTSIITVNEPIE